MRVAIEGNIGSGKSSVLRYLEERRPDVPIFPEPIDTWTELLQLFYDSPAQYALAFGLKVLLSFREPFRSTVCITERSPIACRYVFSQLAYNDGNLTQAEWQLFKEYFEELGWTPDAVIFVDTPAETCLARIAERGRECESRVSLEYLKKVEFLYSTMEKYCGVKKFIRIDGSRPASVVARDVDRELRALGVSGAADP